MKHKRKKKSETHSENVLSNTRLEYQPHKVGNCPGALELQWPKKLPAFCVSTCLC